MKKQLDQLKIKEKVTLLNKRFKTCLFQVLCKVFIGEIMKEKKISLSQMLRLKKEFSMSKTEREQLRILKKEKQEDIKTYLIIINLLLLTTIFSYVLYLMWTYKW